MLDARYRIRDISAIYSPALLFYRDLIERNIRRMIEIAGGPNRLRPHAKTHKTRQIARMQLDLGITKHKCATLAEAEMLAGCGVPDVLVAYPIVGPNCHRLARLIKAYPRTRFSVLADHRDGIDQLAQAMEAEGQAVDVLLDIDVGQHRTGVPIEQAGEMYALLARQEGGLRPGGLHVYDGHNQQESLAERRAAVERLWQDVIRLRQSLEDRKLPVPILVAGGTPTFPLHARMNLRGLELSPGTCVLHDHGYQSRFKDMDFIPAALLLTRVVSRPTPERVTFDLGYKAVASDPPAGQRCILLDLADARMVAQNEEHLVVETSQADRLRPGDAVFAMPTHICPTCAMHREAYVIDKGEVADRWEIVARDRVLTV